MIPSAVHAARATTLERTPLVTHILVPLSTHSSPSRSARQRICRVSLPASASDNDSAARCAPLAIGGSRCRRCSSLPCRRSNVAVIIWVFRTPTSDIHPVASSSMTCVKVITSRPSAILLRDDCAEQAEGRHVVDQLVGIDVVVVEGGCSGHHVLLDEAPNSRHQFGGGGGIDFRHTPRGY